MLPPPPPSVSPAALADALHRHSPRYAATRVGWTSRLIGAAAPLLLVLLLAQAFWRQGLLAWSVGIAYILYDTVLLGFTAWQIRSLGPAPAPAAPGSPTLGVIVAAYNEGATIRAAIDRLLAQDRPPDLLVIADDGSDDDTPDAMRAGYALDCVAGATARTVVGATRLVWARFPRAGKAAALNAALALVDTEMLVTVDADTLLEPGAIAAMRAAFAAHPELVAATGVLAPICGPSRRERLFEWFQRYEYVRNFLSRDAWMRLDGLLLVSGAFAAFRTRAVIAVGGFDPDCLVEDYELIHRLHRYARDRGLGWRVRVVGGALARTDAPASVSAFLKQRQRWFGGFLQTQHWYRAMVGNPTYGRLGTRMLPVKALDTVQPIYGLAAFAVLVWVAATGRFRVALPILGVMVAKIVLDLSFHLWSLARYKAWTGRHEGLRLGPALVAALLEPFSFQLLRHAGAVYGWWAYLRGRQRWTRATRTALR